MDATDIILILDESGSMAPLRTDTIGGVNSFLAEQRKVPGDAYVTLWKFTDRHVITQLFQAKPLFHVKDLTDADYKPTGQTPLLDAVGRAITTYENLPLRAPKAVFLIITDGAENASEEYKVETVRAKIEAHRKEGWAFVFLGANDSEWQAGHLGFSAQSTGSYHATPAGTTAAYSNAAKNVGLMRSSNKAAGVTADTLSWNTGEKNEP